MSILSNVLPIPHWSLVVFSVDRRSPNFESCNEFPYICRSSRKSPESPLRLFSVSFLMPVQLPPNLTNWCIGIPLSLPRPKRRARSRQCRPSSLHHPFPRSNLIAKQPRRTRSLFSVFFLF